MTYITRRYFGKRLVVSGTAIVLPYQRCMARGTQPSEDAAWNAQKARAQAALNYWESFLGLREGEKNDKALSPTYKKHWLCIVRAVSWVESRHGTGSGNHGDRDPMQCGNPDDAWWKSLTGANNTDRIVRGPGITPNYWARELPAAVAASSNFPKDAKLSLLGDVKKGHRDSKFNATMSYFWGVLYLIQRTNTATANGRSFKCDTYSRDRLLKGALRYNAGGDKKYEEKLAAALQNQIGCKLP